MNETPVVSAKNLSKSFGAIHALDNVSLDIHPGRIVGLVGANGGGKSTLMRHMIGLYLPDSGSCLTLGVEAAKLGPAELARIGYVHQEGELIDWMSVAQLIRYVATYYPNWNLDLEHRYVAEFELDLKSRVGALSPGQRQKLAVLLAIGFEPQLLILDEPAAAMDPLARGDFLNLLIEMIQTPGRTILISSHILTDIEKVVDHILIMEKGRFLCDSPLDELRERFHKIRLTSLGGKLPEKLPFQNIVEEKRNGTQAVLTLAECAKTKEELDAVADSIQCQAEILPFPLEDIYRLIVEPKTTANGRSRK